ncbi:thioesterase II family protein [Streptomyces sp. TRM68416]|uniref:thioesterase II family protein n=1 Tax=Streptomyces sp. TRM68416 TaxID=2758412 RepID=UPI0016619CC7|nr:alpha/beta fold hydrolase [Streptomyces sp. TRM68416]MBD0844199.1 thioesterase [Streptomyces sp. TRM68416]
MASSLEPCSPWIRVFHPSPQARVRLVCFPHAGGSASWFHPMSRALTPDVEVLAVQYPGRQERRLEPSFADIAEAAERIVGELSPWRDGPLALFGHSMGATIAYEVALRLEAAGRGPVMLFASGRRAPSRVRNEHIHELPDSGLLAELKEMSGTDMSLLDDPDLRALVLPTLRSDYRAAETYRHREGDRVDCPVLALTGDRDPRADVEDVAAWREHTKGDFDMRVFSGGHFYLTGSDDVVDLLRDCLLTVSV